MSSKSNNAQKATMPKKQHRTQSICQSIISYFDFKALATELNLRETHVLAKSYRMKTRLYIEKPNSHEWQNADQRQK